MSFQMLFVKKQSHCKYLMVMVIKKIDFLKV
jgi:hypothetical protein